MKKKEITIWIIIVIAIYILVAWYVEDVVYKNELETLTVEKEIFIRVRGKAIVLILASLWLLLKKGWKKQKKEKGKKHKEK